MGRMDNDTKNFGSRECGGPSQCLSRRIEVVGVPLLSAIKYHLTLYTIFSVSTTSTIQNSIKFHNLVVTKRGGAIYCEAFFFSSLLVPLLSCLFTRFTPKTLESPRVVEPWPLCWVQWSGRFLDITGWDPSACKSNRLHVDILRFSFTKLGYIL